MYGKNRRREDNLKENVHNYTLSRDGMILIIKANEMHYSSNLFWQRTLHVSDRSTVHHQES